MRQGTILYVGNFELPDLGASANRVMTNRQLFQELGYRTAYLGVTRAEGFSGIRQSSFDPDVYERAYPNGARMWLECSYSLKDILDCAKQYEDLRLIVFYNSPFSLIRRAYRHFSRRGVPVVYDCTEWNPYTEGNLLKRLYKRYDAYRIQHSLEKYVDGLILISSRMDRQYRRKPKALIPPLVDLEAPVWRQKRVRNDDSFEFCYAGDPTNKDDLGLLIDAFMKLNQRNARLVVMGVAQEEFLREHPDYATLLADRPGQLNFMGRVSHDQVIERLVNTDCFVMIRKPTPRNQAGFPTKFAEAYSSGTRIVTTDVSDIHNYAGKTVQVLADPSVGTIQKAMARAMEQSLDGTNRGAFDYRLYLNEVRSFFHQMDGNEKKVK